jgi:hypothetical protein
VKTVLSTRSVNKEIIGRSGFEGAVWCGKKGSRSFTTDYIEGRKDGLISVLPFI